MKKNLLFSLILITSFLSVNAQYYSPNLFLYDTKIVGVQLGLRSSVYTRSTPGNWWDGVVRLSSSADSYGYSASHHYNNLNYIDFLGDGFGIDLGSNPNGASANAPTISIRSSSVGIGTSTPTEKLEIGGVNSATQNNLALWSNKNGFGEHSKIAFKMLVGGGVPNSSVAEIVPSTVAGVMNRLDFKVGAWNNNNDAGAPKLSILSNGNVGIGTTTPATMLDVRTQEALGDAAGLFVPITRLQGVTGNAMMVNDFWVRESAGNDWYSASYMRGVSVDASFLTPETLRSWIKQFPYQNRIDFGSSGQTTMTILKGFVGINCTNPDKELTVKGTIHAKEVLVDSNYPLADFVFAPSYILKPLAEVEAFVKENKHLPEIPSAAEVAENGINLGDMQNKLLQKVEELTLYAIELEKSRNEEIKKRVELEARLAKIETLLLQK